MSIVINVRGTNGSGKTTVVKELMQQFGVVDELIKGGERKPWALELNGNVYVVGSYRTACGGADEVPHFGELLNRVHSLAAYGNVLVEGSLLSTVYAGSAELEKCCNQLRASVAKTPHHFIFGVLDTPVELCIQRVLARRAAAGNTRPFDPGKVVQKSKSVLSAAARLRDAGYDVRILPYQNATETVVRWLGAAESMAHSA